ncbi:MAG: pyridoxal phosphate-dependent aminotransferase [Candidatus Peregrinibacteria bacterium]|nr:pyridoxal phosphate-dependent aminotransferase [Candidatus Peregrinibacteria bacterium]
MDFSFARSMDDFAGEPNDIARLRSMREKNGLPLYDLASANVNDAGIYFPEDVLHDAVMSGLAQAKKYEPDSKGQLVARQAVADYYDDNTSPDRVVITPGTSQSYLYLFKLLANPGDEILVPRPAYPLFEYIARLAEVTLTYYNLKIDNGRWIVDMDSLISGITPRTRAITLISPHNPTGHVLSTDEVRVIASLATVKKIPLIVDEVFCEFVYEDNGDLRDARTLPQRNELATCPLVFTLNGFSKMFALPGMKIGWMVVTGDSGLVRRAVAALETIADTFLATSEPMQFAVPYIFEKGKDFLDYYRKEIGRRLQSARSLYSIVPQGGFYGVRTIGEKDEHEFVLEALREHGILLHPGYFFGLDEPSVVFSFLQKESVSDWSFLDV